MPNLTSGLTKKVGPLPLWGYGVAVTGGLLGWKLLSGGGSDTQYVATPTGAPQGDPSYPSSGAFSQLIDRLTDLENRGKEQPIPVNNPTTPTAPGGPNFDLGTYLIGLRKRYPDIARLFNEKQTAGETTAQRNARLQRELSFFNTLIPIRTAGGQIAAPTAVKPAITTPMIPRSSTPTSPPPSSSPTRLPITRLPLWGKAPEPISAMPTRPTSFKLPVPTTIDASPLITKPSS